MRDHGNGWDAMIRREYRDKPACNATRDLLPLPPHARTHPLTHPPPRHPPFTVHHPPSITTTRRLTHRSLAGLGDSNACAGCRHVHVHVHTRRSSSPSGTNAGSPFPAQHSPPKTTMLNTMDAIYSAHTWTHTHLCAYTHTHTGACRTLLALVVDRRGECSPRNSSPPVHRSAIGCIFWAGLMRQPICTTRLACKT